jgi:hypothetical protein
MVSGPRAEVVTGSAAQQREASGRQERDLAEEGTPEFSAEELQEFLGADRYPIEADPEFKEKLREELWRLVQMQLESPRPRDDA